MTKSMTQNQWLKAHPVDCRRGAPMGNCSHTIEPDTKVHVERLDWVDYDYLRDGTFFGNVQGENMYAIWCDDPVEGRRCIYYRAKTRREAVTYAVEKLDLVPLRGNPKETK